MKTKCSIILLTYISFHICRSQYIHPILNCAHNGLVMAFIQSITKPLNEKKHKQKTNKHLNGINTDSLSYGRLKKKMHCTVTKIIG